MNAQLKKAAPLILVAILALLLFVIKQCKQEGVINPKAKTTNKNRETKTGEVDRDRGFDRRISYLEYSNHARCRMECRRISQAEVEEIMQEGKINYNKSDLQNVRCPRYAVEGITNDNQKVRIVFAQCNDKTVVVTAIDVETEWTCSCPGDDKKYENKN
ncbi:MAG TPA: DUF4258 domain-containing protein [Chitinophagaceae bacterium]|nr:DUF4258 domain-containing protein [Chitinophagaceae bacterium]